MPVRGWQGSKHDVFAFQTRRVCISNTPCLLIKYAVFALRPGIGAVALRACLPRRLPLSVGMLAPSARPSARRPASSISSWQSLSTATDGSGCNDRFWGCVLAWTVAHHAVIDAMGRRMQTKRRGCAVINAASSPMLICRDLRPVSPSCERRYTYLTKLSVLAMMPADLQGVSPCTIKSLHNQVPASCH